MKIRKVIAILATATLAFWTPSIVPVKAFPGCGLLGWRTIDTAYATPGPRMPCPTDPHPGSPWPAFAVIIGASSVMINAIYIWRTQCRELSSQEAMTSAFLPLIGIAFDAQASKCHP
jgi:hypothetical protein